ncbi:hypothetical protein C8Q74DRAFT_40546 [Fomes fomentarius]|nr:hypothetical protein C8Q74DRAFT_40546 [Fomes fomentarius]
MNGRFSRTCSAILHPPTLFIARLPGPDLPPFPTRHSLSRLSPPAVVLRLALHRCPAGCPHSGAGGPGIECMMPRTRVSRVLRRLLRVWEVRASPCSEPYERVSSPLTAAFPHNPPTLSVGPPAPVSRSLRLQTSPHEDFTDPQPTTPSSLLSIRRRVGGIEPQSTKWSAIEPESPASYGIMN